MKKKKKGLVTNIFFILITSLLLAAFFLIYYNPGIIKGDPKKLIISLNGKEEITINYKETYKDEGAVASYDGEDITSLIEVKNNIDYDHVGTYKYTYVIKYRKLEKNVERTINIIDSERPSLELIGEQELIVIQDNKYNDLGVKAVDNYDGDITDKVDVDISNLNMSIPGTYKVIYKAKDSSNNENQIERTVKVLKKGSDNQKVAVLNYHFFYSRDDEYCNSIICLHKDKFREQLKYLKDNGFYTLTIKEFRDWMYGEYNIPEKSVLLTVDDGGNGTSIKTGNYLISALEEYKTHATLFLITGWWGPDDYKSDYLDVQSHTYLLHYEYEKNCKYRSKVNCVSYDELLNDLKLSINVVKDKTSFCFPYYETTETSIKAVKEAGFEIAFIGDDRKASRKDNKYKIPRYIVHKSITMSKFQSMVN